MMAVVRITVGLVAVVAAVGMPYIEPQQRIDSVSRQLDNVTAWGEGGKSSLPPTKSGHGNITCRGEHGPAAWKAKAWRRPLKDSIDILSVEIDSWLHFDKHLKKVVRNASFKVTLLRRVKHPSPDDLLTLYKAQVRPVMEYAPLTWMLSARWISVQRWAECLIQGGDQQRSLQQPWQQQQQRTSKTGPAAPALDCLVHHRRVTALMVLHKAQVQHMSHLVDLRAI
ncbi:uncharacterized protein LOC135107306 [Scylla paramamosain]|uniref:uncharacterized protein LOC135107306 n=1 Tax=Scylla paramamosain TaxID=85552 RepID=UPI003083DCD8